MARRLPPGPRTPVRTFVHFAADPLGCIESLARTYGSISSCLLLRQRVFLLNDPELVKELLVVKHRSFVKDRGIQVAKRLLGEGLLSSEGEFHKRQRRLSQPAFHRERIAAYGAEMVRRSARMRDGWCDGAVVDAAKEMNKLTLGVAGQTLFGADVDREAADVGRALTEALESFTLVRMSFADIMEKLPLPSTKRWIAARAHLDRIVYGMIEARRRSGEDNGDLLSMLLLATDTEGDGSAMSDVQLRDEAMTIFLAGHETTANALTWTWYLLAQHPEAEAKLHAELDTVLAGRLPTFEDVPALRYTEMVFREALRLYPPAWGTSKLLIAPWQIRQYALPAGTVVAAISYLVHRDPRYWPEPERFNPDRWTAEAETTRPRFAYFPFGGGPRQCIGEPFAWLEGILILATLAQRWRLRLVPGHPVVPEPLITLRPKYGMRMLVEPRTPGADAGVMAGTAPSPATH